MILRIGQLLVRANLVTENNLVRALGVQQFAGGRVGTLLLERGSVKEDDLGRALAQQHGCEYVPWRLLGEVPVVTIASLPTKFAIKHAAIPYERGETHLKVALRDPEDLRILDELFFVTGRKILPAVAPEVRIYQALEKYYGERRTPRYAILAEKLSRPARATPVAAAPPPPSGLSPGPAREPAPVPAPQEIWGEPFEADLGETPIIQQSWKIPEHPIGGWAGAASPLFRATDPKEPETIAWEEVPPSLWIPGAVASPPPGAAGSAPAPAEVLPAAAPPTPSATALAGGERERLGEAGRVRPTLAPTPEPSTLATTQPEKRERASAEDFSEVLAAKDRDVIASTALAALSRRFPRAAIFAAKPEGVSGWDAAGSGVDVAALRAVKIPWDEPSVFLNVRLSRSFYLGPLPPMPRHDTIVRALGAPAEECLVQPVLIREKPVAFLYAEFSRDRGATPLDLAYLRELSSAVSSSLVAAIRLKKKEI